MILHGYLGSGPDHWQTWLAGRLQARGERVAYPDLPDPELPRRAAWRAAFADAIEDGADRDRALARVRGLARPLRRPGRAPHGPSACCWSPRRRARARPTPSPSSSRSRSTPAGSPPRRAARGSSARPTIPYCPEDAALLYGAPLGLDVDLLPGAGHVNPEAGYGPWPGVEAWCYGASASTSSRIAPG